jgi:hypothetical protein
MPYQLRAYGDGDDSQPASGVEPHERLVAEERQQRDHGGAHAVAQRCIGSGGHALPGPAPGQRVDSRQEAASHRQEVAEQRLG